MKSLRRLNLESNRVMILVADYFFGLESLEEIHLDDNRIQVLLLMVVW